MCLQRNVPSSGMKSEGTCKSQLISVSFVYAIVPDSKLKRLCLLLSGFFSVEQHSELFLLPKFLLMKNFKSLSFFHSP